jgi:hypothetical protein
MKKKLLLFIAAFFALSGNVMAASYTISVPDFTGYKGSTATMTINLINDVIVAGAQFDMTLPSGVTFASYELTNRSTGMTLSSDNGRYILFSMPDQGVKHTIAVDGSGEAILNFTLDIAETVAPGTYPITFENATISDENNVSVSTTIAQATLTVKEMVTVTLDEESTTVPTATTEPVIAKVKRSINAGQWSTICLPFAMTADQLTEAFGEGVALAEFTGYTVEEDNYTEPSGITLEFTKLAETAGTVANNPYLIKVTNAITYDEGFTVKNVTIDPNEDNTSITISKQASNKKKYSIDFYGYIAKSTMIVGEFFISGGKFYKNTTDGKSIKGFRADFLIDDKMSPAFAKPMSIDIDGETTGIFEIKENERTLTDGVYTINGQYVGKNIDSNTLPKGVYIINGKKKIVK